eukprot:744233_1
MLSLLLVVLLLLSNVSARVYEMELSVDDSVEWVKENNASVYFVLTTTLDGVIHDSPAFVLPDGLPGVTTYTYSLLLDDIGDPTLLRIFHSDSNKLCFNSITIDDQTATRDYDCDDTKNMFECQEIGAYMEALNIVHAPAVSQCSWSEITSHTLLKEYTIDITMDASYYSTQQTFYDNIGFSLEGFVFDSYLTPYYTLSSLSSGTYSIHIVQDDDGATYDKLSLRVLTYDVTPIESIWIGTQNTDALCINAVSISVSNDAIDHSFRSKCISYTEEYKDMSPNGCSVLSINLRKEQTGIETQPECEIADTSFEYNNEQRPSTAKYTLTMTVSEGTTDYIFYQMEGHSSVLYITSLCLTLDSLVDTMASLIEKKKAFSECSYWIHETKSIKVQGDHRAQLKHDVNDATGIDT